MHRMMLLMSYFFILVPALERIKGLKKGGKYQNVKLDLDFLGILHVSLSALLPTFAELTNEGRISLSKGHKVFQISW